MGLQFPSVQENPPISAPPSVISDVPIGDQSLSFYDKLLTPGASENTRYDLPAGYHATELILKLPDELYSSVMNPRRRGTVISWDQYHVKTSNLCLGELVKHTRYAPHHLYKDGLSLLNKPGSALSILVEYIKSVGEINTPLNISVIPVAGHTKLHQITDIDKLTILTNKLVKETAYQWQCLGNLKDDEGEIIRQILRS